MNLADSILSCKPPTKEGCPSNIEMSTVNAPIFGTINDQVPLMYEEPHPCTDPVCERLIIIGAEKRFVTQRVQSHRATKNDVTNLPSWDRPSEMTYEVISMSKYQGDDVVKVLTLEELLDGQETDAELSHAWLLHHLDVLNGAVLTNKDPGYRGYTSLHKLKSHWEQYKRGLDINLEKIRKGELNKTEKQVRDEYHAKCQFSVINDSVDKNFLLRAYITKKLRRNDIQVIWHSCAPQTWGSELRFASNGLGRINPEILLLDEWEKFRKDFHIDHFDKEETILYCHVLEECTMVHTANRARNGAGGAKNIGSYIVNPSNETQEQKNYIDGMYKQCDLISSDLEIIVVQNDPHLPITNKLVFFEGDDHVKSQMAAIGQVVPNFYSNRKRYNSNVIEIRENTTLNIGYPLQQLTKSNELDRAHFARVLLTTQVDDIGKQPSQEVRIPLTDKRGERAALTEQRRARLTQVLPLWQVNIQLAKEAKVMNQVQPNPKFSRVMPENWSRQSPYDDIRQFSSYQRLMHESKPHFQKVNIFSKKILFYKLLLKLFIFIFEKRYIK